MATKRQCDRALAKIHPGAKIIDNSCGAWDAEILAPEGMVWPTCSLHALVLAWAGTHPAKSMFWSDVLTEINDLDPPVKCDASTCNKWVDGHCGVWRE